MWHLTALILGYGAFFFLPCHHEASNCDAGSKQVTWEIAAIQLDGKELDLGGSRQFVVLSEGKASHYVGKNLEGTFLLKVNESAKPRAVDLIDKEGFAWRGIYQEEGDSLKVCLIWAYRRQPERPRPTTFETRGHPTVLYTLRKAKKHVD